MAADAPVDVTDIQFKAHSKYQVFDVNASTPKHNHVDLLATASSYGLVIIGNPLDGVIKVLRLKDIIEHKESSSILSRSIDVQGVPYLIALSCDHSLLAVAYTFNGLSFIDIYAVSSFLSSNVRCITSRILVANDKNVIIKQILWNPVITNTMAICLSNGALGAYVFKDNSFEYHALDKSEEAQCASWSPKGKQIVVAFPNGKLAQYKPDLKLAKTIPCTVQLFQCRFLPIAIQWLSTYQFAVVFTEDKNEPLQSLFIINSPKNAQPTYINFDDICYSQIGPRAPQVFLIHIQQWNLLLMASANGTEIGVLGTTESGDIPSWRQYILADNARAELPLTADKQDTFPIGLALETGCTHQLTIGEEMIPVMPMIHILSTHGLLLSFDLLNLQKTYIDVCSPPQNIADQSGLNHFKQSAITNHPQLDTSPPRGIQNTQMIMQTPNSKDFQSNITFSIPENGATSTPAKPPISAMQPKPTFGLPNVNMLQSKPIASNMFGNAATTIGGFASNTFDLNKELPKPVINQIKVNTPTKVTPKSESNQPFLTLLPNYKPSPQNTKTPTSSLKGSSENDAILLKMFAEEIDLFDREIGASLERSKNIRINKSDKIDSTLEFSKLIKNIDELQEIISQATESTDSLSSDVSTLRLTLYELFSMQAELQSKFEALEQPSLNKPTDDSLTLRQTHKRIINKLEKLLLQNKSNFESFSKQIDANWSDYLEKTKENNKSRMRIPSLENVYQTLEKQHQILLREREKISKIKSKIGIREAAPAQIKYSYSNVGKLKSNKLNNSVISSSNLNNLIDSVLTLTIANQIKNERKQLNREKVNQLRKKLMKREPGVVQPSRPEQKGINSEVIIEKKLAQAKAQKEKENKTKLEQALEAQQQQQKLQLQQYQQQQQLQQKQKAAQEAKMQQVHAPKPITSRQSTLIAKPITAQPVMSNAFSALQKPAFGTVPVAINTQAPKEVETQKSLTKTVTTIGGNKPKLLFGSEAIATKPQINSDLSSGVSFGTPSSTFTFGKPAAVTVDSTKSDVMSGFSLNTANSVTPLNFGKSLPMLNTPNLENEKGIVSVVPNISGQAVIEQKSSLLPSLSLSGDKKENNIAPATTSSSSLFSTFTKLDQKTSPFSIPSQTQIVPQALSTASSTTNIDPNSFGLSTLATADKEKLPFKSNVLQTVSTASSTPSSPFSFSLGDSLTSELKLTTKTNAENTLPEQSIASPISVPKAISTASPSAASFSFAKTAMFGGNATNATSSNVTATAPTSVSSSIAIVSSTPSTDNGSIFKDVSICKPNTADNANAGKSLFSTNSFNAISSSGATPFFSSTATSQSSNIFGGKPFDATESDKSSSGVSSASTNIFGQASENLPANQQSSTNIFGSKTVEPSVFDNFNLSAAKKAPENTNLFGSVPPKSTSNIFGGNVASSPASFFGNTSAATTPSANIFSDSSSGNIMNSSPASIFASATNNPADNQQQAGGIFGSVATNTQNSGSLFSKPFGQQSPASGGSIFGGATTFGSPPPQNTSSIFGVSNTSNGFGGSGGNYDSFGNTTPQNNFGITASANPTFGAAPQFGAAPTFGSPKSGFGTFANISTNSSFGTTEQPKNTLFETLGSSDNGMTFGNLAQNQGAPSHPKPFASGSSFSSWR